MDAATEDRRPAGISAFLAGLQAGMLGICWMLLWLGISAVWQRRSFWTSENLMASVFYGDGSIHSGFAARTLSGLALFLLMYSLLGALLAWIVRDRMTRIRIMMVSVIYAVAWYYLSYQVIWRAVSPLITLLHVERSTVLGHLVYGTMLGRFPVYLPKPPAPPAPEPGLEAPVATEPETEPQVQETHSEGGGEA